MSPLPCSAAAERNKQPILEILRQLLPSRGSALEVASGTGQHVAWFACGLPHWTWQPTDCQASALPAIAARIALERLVNVRAPLQLDVMAPHWLSGKAGDAVPVFDAILCANMLHIAPWPTCSALMQGGARHLAPAGMLLTYGPYLENGVATSPGNLEFDRSLRQRDPSWGLRRRESVEVEAARAGLHLSARHAMPANNLLLVWTAAPTGRPTLAR
ncbi:MAG: DUF938 domain-containing protein [Rhodoferax sp.]